MRHTVALFNSAFEVEKQNRDYSATIINDKGLERVVSDNLSSYMLLKELNRGCLQSECRKAVGFRPSNPGMANGATKASSPRLEERSLIFVAAREGWRNIFNTING